MVDKALPGVRQQCCRDDVQLLRREGHRWRLCCGWWAGRVSRQGTWGSRCASHAATRPMVTVATLDASAVRSAGRYCVSPVVSRLGCLQAAVQATTLQFVPSG